jgi:hypothetical protein
MDSIADTDTVSYTAGMRAKFLLLTTRQTNKRSSFDTAFYHAPGKGAMCEADSSMDGSPTELDYENTAREVFLATEDKTGLKVGGNGGERGLPNKRRGL